MNKFWTIVWREMKKATYLFFAPIRNPWLMTAVAIAAVILTFCEMHSKK